jgi:hypothetical protein
MSTTAFSPAEFVHNEPVFRQKMPFPLVSTNLKGVYGSPAPADAFDPNKATVTDLVKNGLLWRRPGANDPPAVQAAWQKIFEHRWLAKDRIVPVMATQTGRTHVLRAPLKKGRTDQSFTNSAWAGAGTRNGGPWTSVIGFWDIPTVSKPSEPQGVESGGGWKSSSWLGIDGFDIGIVSNDVLQAGIEQFVASNGHASYVAWYEWYSPIQAGSPAYVYQTNITNFPVGPGQQI